MRVEWSPHRLYRCFYSPSVQMVDIVSSHLVQNAHGRVISDMLALVVDDAGEFCDLEMTLSDECRVMAMPMPREAMRADGLVVTDVDDSANVCWFLDEALATLVVGLSSDPPERWLEIYKDRFYLGVDLQGQLRAIVFRNFEVDPEGQLQDSWLEHLESEA